MISFKEFLYRNGTFLLQSGIVISKNTLFKIKRECFASYNKFKNHLQYKWYDYYLYCKSYNSISSRVDTLNRNKQYSYLCKEIVKQAPMYS